MKEYSIWGVLEAEYIFKKGAKKDLYQGGIGSRFGGKAQTLPLPEECDEVVNTGKTASTKYVVCKCGEDYFMKEFSNFGVLEATYVFTRKADDNGRYQGGWLSRFGGKPQVLKLPDQCKTLQSIGKTRKAKYVNCVGEDGTNFLKEYSDWKLLQATYVFTKDAEGGVGYQGGLVSRFGGKPQILKVPDECMKVLNVGKDRKKKFVVCETNKGDYMMKEFSNWGIFEATYRFGFERTTHDEEIGQ